MGATHAVLELRTLSHHSGCALQRRSFLLVVYLMRDTTTFIEQSQVTGNAMLARRRLYDRLPLIAAQRQVLARGIVEAAPGCTARTHPPPRSVAELR